MSAAEAPILETREAPRNESPATAHFQLHFYGAILHLLDHIAEAFGSLDAVFKQFPFLAGYNDELAKHGMEGLTLATAAGRWHDDIRAWEESTGAHLPIRALATAARLDATAMTILLTVGLIEEDWRFGPIFEMLQGIAGQTRPTVGLLLSWPVRSQAGGDTRESLKKLHELGLIAAVDSDLPRSQWTLHVPALLWDALRGDTPERPAPWLAYRPPAALPEIDQLIIPDEFRKQLTAATALLATRQIQTLILRGPRRNGRGFALASVARMLDCGLLEVNGLAKQNENRWRFIGPLATMLHAFPCVVFDSGPGETIDIPELDLDYGPLGVIMGNQGGLSGSRTEQALTLRVDMPKADLRRQLWQRFAAPASAELDAIANRFRLTSGHIREAANLAASFTALESRASVTLPDIRRACRTLHRQALDTLAAHVEKSGSWGDLVVTAETFEELKNLELRCRYREQLGFACGNQPGGNGSGVRALFKGPSGTGKTLAASLLASALEKDLYRVDLSTVVNKFIGETEKNLNQIFTLAEELDIILFLDEGDALLTQRTSVQTSNDRYANLETNYLLQRIESFDGILVVATNAGDRIDSAFQRRMDVVVNFQLPETAERWTIWQVHLAANHRVDPVFLSDIAKRCILTGGQIRNAVLHASVMAMEQGQAVTSAVLFRAVEREYRKSGGVCPLRDPARVGNS